MYIYYNNTLARQDGDSQNIKRKLVSGDLKLSALAEHAWSSGHLGEREDVFCCFKLLWLPFMNDLWGHEYQVIHFHDVLQSSHPLSHIWHKRILQVEQWTEMFVHYHLCIYHDDLFLLCISCDTYYHFYIIILLHPLSERVTFVYSCLRDKKYVEKAFKWMKWDVQCEKVLKQDIF